MTNTTVDRSRFIRRIQDDCGAYPTQLPSRTAAMEVDAAVCHFVSTIAPGTAVKDLPKLVIESGMFEFDRWAEEVHELTPRIPVDRVNNIIRRSILSRFTAALKAQWVGGIEGREAVFE